MMSLTFGLFTQVSGSGPLGPLVVLKGNDQTLHAVIIHLLFPQIVFSFSWDGFFAYLY